MGQSVMMITCIVLVSYFAVGVGMFVALMRWASKIPHDRTSEFVDNHGNVTIIGNRESMITYAWLAIPFWYVHACVLIIMALGALMRKVEVTKLRATDTFFTKTKLAEVLMAGGTGPVWVRDDAVKRIECNDNDVQTGR